MLDNRQCNAGDVGLLERIGTDEVGAHLAGDGHHGHAVQVSVGDTRHQVAGARSRGGDTHAHFARRPRIPVGGMRSALLMTGEDVANIEVIESIVQGNDAPARITEDHIHAFALQCLEKYV